MLPIIALLASLASGVAGKIIEVNYEHVKRTVGRVELVTSEGNVRCLVWNLSRDGMKDNGLSFQEASIVKGKVAELDVDDGLKVVGVALHYSDGKEPESRNFPARKFTISQRADRENWHLWSPA
jgi:hypothetical protein